MVRSVGEYEAARILSPVTVRSMTKNRNFDIPNRFDAWALGFNIRCDKYDDLGSCRPELTLNHDGWAAPE